MCAVILQNLLLCNSWDRKTRLRTKATRIGRFLCKSTTLAGTPDPPNLIAVIMGVY